MGPMLKNVDDDSIHINCWNICSSSVEDAIGTLIGIALNLKIALHGMDILKMLILLIHEHSICFHLFVPSTISLFRINSI